MFDGLTKSKFYCKCKSDLKMVKTRVDMIKKKRDAMQKYLREDIVDLLRNGLDSNAYGRAEGLLVELYRTECYEFINHCAGNVLNHLAVMNKQGECPEECREAVSSLMFAAARLADLPELRELRTIFSEKYGNYLDGCENKQFVEKMTSGHPSSDKKVRLLLDIAQESGLQWNSKLLENKLRTEALCKEMNDRQYNLPKRVDGGSVQEKDKKGTGGQCMNMRGSNVPEKRLSHHEKKEATGTERRLPKEPHQVLPVKDIQVDKITRIENQSKPISAKSNPKEEGHDKPQKVQLVPPPYTRSEVNKEARSNGEKMEPTELIGTIQDDSADKRTKPTPKSVRRRNSRPPTHQESAGSLKTDEQKNVKDINKEKAAQAKKILKFLDGGGHGGHGRRDEEEIMMDKLLRHYSRKNTPDGNAKPDPVGKTLTRNTRSKDVPSRSSSLPSELTSPTETPKGHTRNASLQPEVLNENNAHVHPKLPDYDDFCARLEAFRRKS